MSAPKKHYLYACSMCGKVTSTTSKWLLGFELCKACREKPGCIGRGLTRP